MVKNSQEFPGLELRYKRFALVPGQRIGPLINKARRRGIYILEFTNGEYYVGQAKNVVTRFAQHRHGHTNHNEPWDDIDAVQFAFVPKSINLNIAEAHEIRRLRDEGLQLRNRARNFGHTQLSKLDAIISVEDQIHWATGGATYNSINSFRSKLDESEFHVEIDSVRKDSSPRRTGTVIGNSKASKAASPEFRELLFDDLCFMVSSVIPNAVELESRYWTISDYPSTSGGRWATVNTGPIEAMFFPRKFPIEFSNDDGETITLPATAINLALEQGREPDADGFFLNGIYWFVEGGNSAGEASGANSVSSHNQDAQERTLSIYSYPVKYKSVTCEHLVVPTGYAEAVLMDFPGLLERARKFVIAAMRQNECGMYRRWHSEQLAAEVYEGILQRWQE